MSTGRRSEDTATLVDLLDTVIEKGAVVSGDVVLSVAEVDLVHLGLRLVLRGLDGPVDGTRRGLPHGAGQQQLPGPPGSAATADRARDQRGAAPDPVPSRTRASDGDALGEVAGAQLSRLIDAGRTGDAEPADVQRGLAALVLTLVEVLRDLMERQALRRMTSGTVDDLQVERLGQTFLALRQRMDELKDAFGLTDEDLDLDLGPLGHLR
ncbi:MAG: gas vesicle protein K [Actinobacteria bacterium]|nr:gas vesicle protein K [Actinomycetota bacterium]